MKKRGGEDEKTWREDEKRGRKNRQCGKLRGVVNMVEGQCGEVSVVAQRR